MDAKLNIRDICIISILIGMQIILTRFLSVQTPIVRIGFAFVPLAFCAMLYGPVRGGIAAAIADVAGMLMFPSGAYFPGFTFTAFLTGAVYGLFLYRKPKTALRMALAAMTVCLLINLGLDTLWLKIITGKAYIALLPARIIKNAAMIPVQMIMLKLLWKYIMERLAARYI